jgi:thioredoxin reductase (NADPH)
VVAKPVILTVDDDPEVSQAMARDLRHQYGADYQVVRATSGPKALTLLTDYALRDRRVALIASDQRMPGMTGVEFFEQVRQYVPEAKLVLITAYADIDVAVKAINDVHIDHYLFKPWDPPAERLYPVLDDLLQAWTEAHPLDPPRHRVIGHRWSAQSHEIKTFLTRNYVEYRWLDLERDEEARQLAEAAGAGVDDLPLVLLADGAALRNPSMLDLASAVGRTTTAEKPLYDLCIVGSGPAGLAAAVYASSEGLDTVVVERQAPGGQAGLSTRIENYLGFPGGVTGADLAQRAVAQARRFGAEMVLAREVVAFQPRGQVRAVCFGDGTEIEARTTLVATGVWYQRLNAPGCEQLAGRGVYYGASASDFAACAGDDVYTVGAANSAGQAAVNLSKSARRVVMLVRAEGLEQSMSHYLVERIRATPNIEVRPKTEVVSANGTDHLEGLTIVDQSTGAKQDVQTNWLFAFVGATPATSWLGDTIARDDRGFVLTGPELVTRKEAPRWPLSRPPFALETSVPGVFAAGDVRLESMKRVAAAVGEGAMAVYLVHRYLATI